MNVAFGRRNFVAGVAAALVTPLMSNSQEHPSKKSNRGLRADGCKVNIWSSRDSKYRHMLDTHFPGIMDDPRFQPLFTMSAIINNREGANILAYAIKWRFRDQNGYVDFPMFGLAHPVLKKGNTRRRVDISGSKVILRSGAYHLVTPYFTLTPKAYRSHKNADWSKFAQGASAFRSFLAQYSSNDQLESIKLDSVVYKDHSLLGPDTTKLRTLFQAVRNGERQAAIEVMKASTSIKSDNEMGRHLVQKYKLTRETPTRRERYREAGGKLFTMHLLRICAMRGRAAVEKAARKVAITPRTRIKHVIGKGRA